LKRVAVCDAPDETLVTGASGFAGGSMSPETFDELQNDLWAEGRRVVADTVAGLGIGGVETRVLRGDPGAALCALAVEVGATRGCYGFAPSGGIKRGLFRSVSDFVVRNAPCPVVVARGDVT
jgi:nucleotide-binding universal stress UspA family protein